MSCLISIARQTLSYNGRAYPVSTGKAGIGFEGGSGKTPVGRFIICSKHGENAPLNAIFRARIPCGLWRPAVAPQGNIPIRDAILARILCLEGLDPDNANTRSRYIYIHGTNDLQRLGIPASHGCIRMAPQDIAELYPAIPIGERVRIS